MDFILISSPKVPPFDWGFLTGKLSSRLSFARSSTAQCFGNNGYNQAFAIDAPRFAYDPLTVKQRGFLCEAQRTNAVRNSTMQGASAAPSTLPTYWNLAYTQGTITSTVVTVGSEYDLPFIDIRFRETMGTGGSGTIVITFDSLIAATVGQTWTASFFARMVGGSKTNVTSLTCAIDETTSAGSYLTSGSTRFDTVLDASLSRASHTRTTTSATIGRVMPKIAAVLGENADITLRLYAPQCEIGSTTSSFIPTSTTQATRAADQLSLTIPKGVTGLRYVFDDETSQDVAVSAGAYTVPTILNRPYIKRIVRVS